MGSVAGASWISDPPAVLSREVVILGALVGAVVVAVVVLPRSPAPDAPKRPVADPPAIPTSADERCAWLARTLTEECPHAGVLAPEACRLEPAKVGHWDGQLVHFGGAPTWFVSLGGRVFAHNNAAVVQCDGLQTVPRAEPPAAATSTPETCTGEDLRKARVIDGHLEAANRDAADADDVRTKERAAMRKAAKQLGISQDAARDLYLRVDATCPGAM
jgi:hypothetical protein